MIIVLKPGATQTEIDHVIEKIQAAGCTPHLSRGVERTIIGAIGDESALRNLPLEILPGVDQVLPIMKPYKLVSREFKPEPSVLGASGVLFGGRRLHVVAGPCAVEGREMLVGIARQVKAAGATVLRGGAFKPRTSILDSVPTFIWYKDANNRIIRANRPAAESIGLSVAAIEGRSTYELHPEHAAKYHRDDLEVIHSGHAKLGIVEPFVAASGARRWVRTDKVPYRDESGVVVGVIVFAVDITEREDAENALREARDTLERRVADRTKELASALTELRREMTDRQRAEDRIGQHRAALAHLQRLRTVEGMTASRAEPGLGGPARPPARSSRGRPSHQVHRLSASNNTPPDSRDLRLASGITRGIQSGTLSRTQGQARPP